MDDTQKPKGRRRTRANGDAAPSFDKSKNLWYVWVWIAGKRVKRSAKTKPGALLQLKELQRLRDMGIQVPPEKLTAAEWVRQWIETKKAIGLDDGTIRNYQFHLSKRIVPYVGHYSLAKLSTLHIQGSINRLLTETDTSPSTISMYVTVLSSALENAVRLGMLYRNPAKGVQLPRKSTEKKAEAMSPAQARAFFNAATGHRFELAFWIALALGGRRGEVLGLKWSSISWDMKTIAITGQVKDIGTSYGYAAYTKGRKPRVVRVPTVIMKMLRVHRERQNEIRLVAGDKWEERDFVFPNRTGGPVNPESFTLAFATVVRHANALVDAGEPGERIPEKARPHSFRNTAGTFYVMLGASSREVQDILGHQSITTTEGYLSVLPVMSEANADRMGGLLEKLGES